MSPPTSPDGQGTASPTHPSSPLSHLSYLPQPEIGRSASAASHRSTASTSSARARAQQSTYVVSGNPLAPRLGGGLAERESQYEGNLEAEESAFTAFAKHLDDQSTTPRAAVQHIEYSPAPSRSSAIGSRTSRRSRGATDTSPSRSRSRPVGAALSRDRRERSKERKRDAKAHKSDSSDDEFASHDSDDEQGAHSRGQSWDNLRDGSISRRPAWRRPSPRWVLPFVLGATLSLGMTLAVRAELYLDLACLVHPPRMPSSSNSVGTSAYAYGERVLTSPNHLSSALDYTPFWPLDTTATSFSNFSVSVQDIGIPLPLDPVLSPSEKWFHWAQKDIHAYLAAQWRLKHPKDTDETPIPPLPSDPAPGMPKEPAPAPPTPFPEIDPAQCKRDAGVQQTAARLSQILTVVGGLLSAITTGWWARYSDHRGRRRVLAITELGLLLNDACFLIIASYPRLVIQTELWILLVGPAIDGILGGFSTITATMHAYISDVTPDGSRATAFSRLGAALMAGLAIGPVLGSTLISATGNLLSPFYVSVSIHTLFVLLIRFVLPESLSSDSRAMLDKRAKAIKQANRERDVAERAWEADGDEQPTVGDSGFSRIATPIRGSRFGRRTVGEARRMARRAILPLQPLAVFWPHRNAMGIRNYNLLLLGVLNFIVAQMMGVVAVKAQYTFWAFGWSPPQLGPYLSFISCCRLIVLLVLLPLIMRRVKPYFQERTIIEAEESDAGEWAAPATERTPLLSANGAASSSSSNSNPPVSPTLLTSPTSPIDNVDVDVDADTAAKPKPKPKRSAKLDIYVVRCCLFVEMCAFTTMGSNIHASPALFIIASMLSTLGSPGAPAANSLALSFLEHKRDAGRLFGGIAVLHAVGASLVAPILFFSVFSATVSWYAPTVFLVAAGMILIAFTTMLFVRVPRTDTEAENGRGRGRGAKRIRSTSRLRAEE